MHIDMLNQYFEYILLKNLEFASYQKRKIGLESLLNLFPMKSRNISGLAMGGLSTWHLNKMQFFTLLTTLPKIGPILKWYFPWDKYFHYDPRGCDIWPQHIDNLLKNGYIEVSIYKEKSYTWFGPMRSYDEFVYTITQKGMNHLDTLDVSLSDVKDILNEQIQYNVLFEILKNPNKKGRESGKWLTKWDAKVHTERLCVLIPGSEEIETNLGRIFYAYGYKLFYVDNKKMEDTTSYSEFKEFIKEGRYFQFETFNKWEHIKYMVSNPKKSLSIKKLEKIIFIEPPPYSIFQSLSQTNVCTIPSFNYATLCYDILNNIQYVENNSDNFIKGVPTKVIKNIEDIKTAFNEMDRIVLRPRYKQEKENGRNVYICNTLTQAIKIYHKLSKQFGDVCLQPFIEGNELIFTLYIDKNGNCCFLDPIGYNKKFKDIGTRHSANHILSWFPAGLNRNDINRFKKILLKIFSKFKNEPGAYIIEIKQNEKGFFYWGEMDWHPDDSHNIISYFTHIPPYDSSWAHILCGKPIEKPKIRNKIRSKYVVAHSIQKYQKELWLKLIECYKSKKIQDVEIKFEELRSTPMYPDSKLGFITLIGDNLDNLITIIEDLVHGENMRYCNDQ